MGAYVYTTQRGDVYGEPRYAGKIIMRCAENTEFEGYRKIASVPEEHDAVQICMALNAIIPLLRYIDQHHA